MEAKAYLQRKFLHSKLVFIVASDDRKWCQEMFAKEEDMMMTHLANRAGLDLAILSQCNHSIIRLVFILIFVSASVPWVQNILIMIYKQRMNLPTSLGDQIFFVVACDGCLVFEKITSTVA